MNTSTFNQSSASGSEQTKVVVESSEGATLLVERIELSTLDRESLTITATSIPIELLASV
jgi:hypothetical protein